MSDFFRPLRRQNNPSKRFRVRTTCAIGCFILSGVLPLSTLAATSQEKSALPAEETSTKPFEYKLENRPDPFVPFITEKAASSNVNMDEIIDSGEPLTGMQLFEPGQLTVVALVKTGDEHMAMVQDTTGKGYTLLEGTKIGRYGIVKGFTPQSVIVEETTVTRAGKQSVTEVVMLLKKEGEK
jgi:Tfp pilus assembly protein PilP